MFIESKYSRWYFSIINTAKSREILGYVERHHIIPKSLGGSNKKDNIVRLTAKEHFVCHHLLCYMCEGRAKKKMQNALGKFMQTNSLQERNLTAMQYEIARKMLSKSMTGRKFSEETKAKLRLARSLQDMSYRIGSKHSDATRAKIKEKRALQDMSHRKGKTIGACGLSGDLNYAKRPEVRQKLSEGKIGDLNPMKKMKGKVIMINDGLITKYHPINEPVPSGWSKGRSDGSNGRLNKIVKEIRL